MPHFRNAYKGQDKPKKGTISQKRGSPEVSNKYYFFPFPVFLVSGCHVNTCKAGKNYLYSRVIPKSAFEKIDQILTGPVPRSGF